MSEAVLRRAVLPRQRTATLQREAHQPDYVILVAVVALAAIGILMVYSSSAMRAYVDSSNTFQIVGPQIQWAALGVVAMAVTMRLDYRLLRVVSIPLYLAAIVLLLLVLVPALNREVGGSARWLQVGSLPAVHPAEFAKLALVVYLAHWFARRGSQVRSWRSGTIPFLALTGPIVLLVVREPDLGTATVIAVTAFTLYFLAGANLLHVAAMAGAGLLGGLALIVRTPYMLSRVQGFTDPWQDPLGKGFHTIQGLFALGLGGLFGAGLGASREASGLYLPNAFNDYIFAIIGEEFGLLGGIIVIGLFIVLAYAGIRTALRAPDTFGGLLAAGITAWLCIQAFINIGVVVALLPVTGIPLPFISAGGSSLVISFAAVGILLSISRETVERGTWNDAAADRGRGHGRAHLPGPRRRPIAAR